MNDCPDPLKPIPPKPRSDLIAHHPPEDVERRRHDAASSTIRPTCFSPGPGFANVPLSPFGGLDYASVVAAAAELSGPSGYDVAALIVAGIGATIAVAARGTSRSTG
jgi:hypothetical protein